MTDLIHISPIQQIVGPGPERDQGNHATGHDPRDAALWAECVRRWLESVQSKHGSQRSPKEYQKILAGFFEWLGAGKHPADVAGLDCQRWVAALREQGLTANTIKTRLGAVSSFYKFACSKFEIRPGQYLHNFNPASAAQRPHVNPYENAQGLSIEDAGRLLKSCDKTTLKGSRDYALLAFYIYTGRRRAEVARLCWRDLRAGQGRDQREYHYTGKGGKTAWRELPPPVWNAIKDYLTMSGRADSMKPDSPLFTSTEPGAANNCEPIGERTVSQIVADAGKRAGLGHIKVHSLRHTAAKLRDAAGDDLRAVQDFLDHSNPATTTIYLNAVKARRDNSWQKVEGLLGL